MTSQGFQHRLRVLRPNSVATGSQNSDGIWTPTQNPEAASGTVVYDDLADVQVKWAVVTRLESGEPVETADAIAFLADESLLPAIAIEDLAEVTWEDGTVDTGTIIRNSRLDGSIFLSLLMVAHTDIPANQIIPPVATVTVQPQVISPAVEGTTTQLTAVVQDGDGNILTGMSVRWYTSDQTKATVSAGGLVSWLSPGFVAITAVCEGVSGDVVADVTSPTDVGSVTVTPGSPFVEPGTTTQFTATIRDSGNNVLTGRSVSWYTSDSSKATVSSTGLVTWLPGSSGVVNIVAICENVLGDTFATIAAVATVTLTPSAPAGVVGSTTQMVATLRDAASNVLTGRTVSWYTSNSAVATVSSTGLVTWVGAGVVTITVVSENVLAETTSAVTDPNAALFRYVAGDSLLGALTIRGSTAVYYDSSRIRQIAAIDVARDNHYINGVRTLLVEVQRINRCTTSEGQTGWGTVGGPTRTGGQLDPAGGNSAVRILAPTAGTSTFIATPLGSAVQHALSLDVKRDGFDGPFEFYWNDGTASANNGMSFTFVSGVPVISNRSGGSTDMYAVTQLANGFYRISCRCLRTAVPANLNQLAIIVNPPQSIIVNGAQIEELTASSYIKTTGTAVTRAGDQVSEPFLVSPRAMTLYMKFFERGTRVQAAARLWQIGDLNSNNFMTMFSDGTNYILSLNSGGVTKQSTLTGLAPAIHDLVETRCVVNADGSVQAFASLNSGAEQTFAASSAGSLPVAWNSGNIGFGSAPGGAAAGQPAIAALKVVGGLKTLAQMQAL